MLTPWPALEQIPGLIALPVAWRKLTGEHYPAFKTLCLESSHKRARSYPCSLASSCVFRISPAQTPLPSESLPSQDASFTGHCERDPQRCEHITLSVEEITGLQLSWT